MGEVLKFLSVDFTTPAPWIAMLVLSWGYIVWMIVTRKLVPGPFYVEAVTLAKEEQANRRALQTQVDKLVQAMTAVAAGVEAIKAATVPPPRRRWGREDPE